MLFQQKFFYFDFKMTMNSEIKLLIKEKTKLKTKAR